MAEPEPAAAGGSAAHGPAEPAVRDLAHRLGVAPEQVHVLNVEDVTWRDGSLGCPQPGMMYPQVLTPGRRIVLESGGERYEYHSGSGREPFLCEHPEPPAPAE
ncbi:MAG: hypothetical protein M3P83_06315 [Actinomycetota bacterium]|nr:hypothetical protein [Actinomycetota bacterium]